MLVYSLIIRYNPAILGTGEQKTISDTKYKETSRCNTNQIRAVEIAFITAPLHTQLSTVSGIHPWFSSWTLHSTGKSKQYG